MQINNYYKFFSLILILISAFSFFIGFIYGENSAGAGTLEGDFKNTWKNLATCCRSCNVEKDNKTLEEANLKLEYQPYRPTYLQFVKNININGGKNWLPYLFS